MSRFAIRVGIVTALLLSASGHAADGAPILRSNPFDQPVATDRRAAAPAETVELIDLRGTIIAGTNSRANISGTLLGIGEKIAGHQLISVQQGRVTLVKNGVEKTLTMNADDGNSRND